MNNKSRLGLIAQYLGFTEKEFRKELINFTNNSNNKNYAGKSTVYNYFKLFKSSNGDIVESSGASKKVTQAMSDLVNSYLIKHFSERGETYNLSFSLESDLKNFIIFIRQKISLKVIKSYLSSETAELIEAFAEASSNRVMYIPQNIRMSREETKEYIQDLIGKFALYRFRGAQHDDHLLVEEQLEIWVDDVPWMQYSDWHGETFKGIIIFGKDKISANLLSEDSSIRNLRGVHISMFITKVVDEYLLSVTRYAEPGKMHNYRALVVMNSTGFKPRGEMERICKEAIEYFYVLDANSAVSGNVDSSFALDLDFARGKLKEGQRFSNLYLTKISKGGQPQLTNAKTIPKVISYLEQRFRAL